MIFNEEEEIQFEFNSIKRRIRNEHKSEIVDIRMVLGIFECSSTLTQHAHSRNWFRQSSRIQMWCLVIRPNLHESVVITREGI